MVQETAERLLQKHLSSGGGTERIIYCDGNEKKQNVFLTADVISPEELKEHRGALIIIASLNYFYEMADKLNVLGIQDYYDMEEMFNTEIPYANLSYQAQDVYANKARYFDVINHSPKDGSICIGKIEMTVSEACSLNCRDCSYLMPYYKHPRNISAEQCVNDIDCLLKAVDRISELRLLGGEPFVNPEIDYIIEHCKRKDEIGMIDIHTNGTLIPKENVLRSLQSRKVIVHISDYDTAANKIKELTELFDEVGISYFVRKYSAWNKMGIMEEHEYSAKQLDEVFMGCTARNCYTLREGRLYHCARSAHATAIGMIPEFKTDYVSIDASLSKSALKNYLQGKEPLRACGFCLGGYAVEKVAAAIQIDRNDK